LPAVGKWKNEKQALISVSLSKLRRASDEQAVAPGSAWVLNVPASGEAAVTVTDPQGHPFPAQVMASGRTTRLALPSARLPGAYPVKQGETVVSYGIVNVDARESDTCPMALETPKPGERSTVTVA